MSLSYVPEGINIEIQGLVGQKSARNAFEVDLWDVVETSGNHEEMWKYTLQKHDMNKQWTQGPNFWEVLGGWIEVPVESM